MWLRSDTRGEIGVFEDLQTLVVVVVGIAILLGATLYNWATYGEMEQEQELYDEAAHIIKQVEAWDWLGAINSYGSPYPDFMIWQPNLIGLTKNDTRDDIKSTLHFHITFDDLVVPDSEHDPGAGNYSYYSLGDPIPEGKETVAASVQYTLVFGVNITTTDFDVFERHACIMTVVVWR